MIEILIAIIALTVISVWATSFSWSFLGELIAPIFCILGFFGLILYAVLGWHYFAADHKAKIINREFGTSYTQEEVFYAESVIDTIREIQRQRIEINGDVIEGE